LLIKLTVVALATFVINMPFGYWREGVRKFSPYWFIAVHAAVPLVVLMRHKSHLGFAWYTYPPMIICYFGGQFVGSRFRRRRIRLAAEAAQGSVAELS
jgi:hypothetical protein